MGSVLLQRRPERNDDDGVGCQELFGFDPGMLLEAGAFRPARDLLHPAAGPDRHHHERRHQITHVCSHALETVGKPRRTELYTVSMSDWDAARYHRLSDPQRSWGLRVLERLAPAPGEWILDIGCGTGRLTSEIQARVPSVHLT